MPNYMALLSGFNEALAFEELKALAEPSDFTKEGRVVMFDSDRVEKLKEAAIVHNCSDFFCVCRHGYLGPASKIKLDGKSFRVECVKIPGGLRLGKKRAEREIGLAISGANPGIDVDFYNPELRIFVVMTEEKLYVGRLLFECDRQFLFRKPRDRKFFHPASMHPRIAKLMANLGRVSSGKKVLDPFCGAGGILIEAGYLGGEVYGLDISPKMAKGCRKNLDYYGLGGTVMAGDAREVDKLFGIKFDAVVTDPPYGRMSSAFKEKLDSLYGAAFKAIFNALSGKGCLAVSLPDKKYIELVEAAGFILKSHGVLPVHGSLTRHICTFEKKGD